MQGRTRKGKNGVEKREQVGTVRRKGEREGGRRRREREREREGCTNLSKRQRNRTNTTSTEEGGRQSRQAATIERESEKLVNPINQ